MNGKADDQNKAPAPGGWRSAISWIALVVVVIATCVVVLGDDLGTAVRGGFTIVGVATVTTWYRARRTSH